MPPLMRASLGEGLHEGRICVSISQPARRDATKLWPEGRCWCWDYLLLLGETFAELAAGFGMGAGHRCDR
jgi:hypothetical protein